MSPRPPHDGAERAGGEPASGPLPALGRLILAAAKHTQLIVVSHAAPSIDVLAKAAERRRLHLVKEFGETKLESETLFNRPKWMWPAR